MLCLPHCLGLGLSHEESLLAMDSKYGLLSITGLLEADEAESLGVPILVLHDDCIQDLSKLFEQFL